MTIEHRVYPGKLEACDDCGGGGHPRLFVFKVGPSCTHYECSDCGRPYGGVETSCAPPTKRTLARHNFLTLPPPYGHMAISRRSKERSGE